MTINYDSINPSHIFVNRSNGKRHIDKLNIPTATLLKIKINHSRTFFGDQVTFLITVLGLTYKVITDYRFTENIFVSEFFINCTKNCMFLYFLVVIEPKQTEESAGVPTHVRFGSLMRFVP